MDKEKRYLFLYLTLIFICSLVISSLFIYFVGKLNWFLLAFLVSVIVLIFGYLFLKIRTEQNIPFHKGKTALRYTMSCHRCNWQWMSNTSDKKPRKCPNCGEFQL